MTIGQSVRRTQTPADGVRLGIVVALPDEARPLVHRRAPIGTVIRLDPACELAVGGIGFPAAARAARALIERGATALLGWGTAGGLDPRLPAGALLLPRAVVSDGGGEAIAVDADWHARVAIRLAGLGEVHTGSVLSSGTALVEAASKAAAFEASHASAVDMESLALVRVAAESTIPVLILRVVVDTASQTLPKAVVGAMTPGGRVHLMALGKGLVRRPSEIPALLHLARDFQLARRKLAEVVELLRDTAFLAPSPPPGARRSAA